VVVLNAINTTLQAASAYHGNDTSDAQRNQLSASTTLNLWSSLPFNSFNGSDLAPLPVGSKMSEEDEEITDEVVDDCGPQLFQSPVGASSHYNHMHPGALQSQLGGTVTYTALARESSDVVSSFHYCSSAHCISALVGTLWFETL